MRRQLNFKFLALLLAGTAVFGALTHVLHGFQMTRNATGLRKYGEEAEAKQQYDVAANYLGRYLSFVPDDVDTREKYGIVLDELSQRNLVRNRGLAKRQAMQAFFVLDQVLRRDPERGKIRRRQVDLAMKLGDFSSAKTHLLHLLGSDENAELEQLLGQCEGAIGKNEEAIAWFTKAVKHAPAVLDNYVYLAVLYRDRHAKADKVMADMVQANPKTFKAWLLRADYWIDRSKKEPEALARAADDLGSAATLAPDELDVLLGQVKLARLKSDNPKSRRLLLQALKLYPKNAGIYLTLIELERQDGQPKKAEEYLRDALAVSPDNDDLLLASADLSIQQGELAKGQQVVDQLDERYRKYGERGARHALLDFHRARIKAAKGEWGDARNILEDLHERKEADFLGVTLNLLLAESHERLGNPDQALVSYQKVVKVDPLSVRGRAGVAGALLALGRHDEAAAEYRQIMAFPKVPATARTALARLLIIRNLRLPKKNRNWDEVRAELAQSARELPDSVDVPILLAESYFFEDPKTQAKKARDILEKARDKHPEQSALWVALARLAGQTNPTEGLDVLDKAKLQPKLVEPVQLALARMSFVGRLPEKEALAALKEMEKSVEAAPKEDRINLLLGLANAYFMAAARADAYRLLEQVALDQPASLPLRLILFDLAALEKKEDDQRRLLGEIKKLEGNDGSFWRQAEAILLVNEAQAAPENGGKLLFQARQRLAETAKRRPSWYRVPALEAVIDEREERPERAIEDYQRAMRLGDHRPETVRRLIQLLFERRRFKEADQAVSQLINQEQTLSDPGLGKLATEALLRSGEQERKERALDLALKSVSGSSRDYRDHLWLGQVLWRLKRLPEAEKELERARQLNPDAPETWVSCISFFAGSDRKDHAKELLAEAKKQLKGDGADLALGEGSEAVGHMKEAEDYFLRALRAKPEAGVKRNVAGFYLRSKQPDKAQPLLRELCRGTAKKDAELVPWARRSLAVLLTAKQKYKLLQEAKALLDENIRAGDAAVEDKRLKAILLASHPGLREEAISLLEDANRQEPLGGPELFVLARLYDADNNWPKAQIALLTLLGGTQDAQKTLGYAAYYVRRLIDRKDLAKAEVWLTKLERQAPQALGVTELKARLLSARGKHQDAIELLRDAAKQAANKDFLIPVATLLENLAPKTASSKYFDAAEAIYRQLPASPQNTLALGRFLVSQKRLNEALTVLEKVVDDKSPQHAAEAILAVLTSEAAETPHYQQVETWLRRASQETPGSTLLALALGLLRDRQGRYDEAMSIYRGILVKEPDNALALNNLAWLVAFQEKNYTKALALIEQASASGGPTAGRLDTRGVILVLKGDTRAAIKDFETAIAMGGLNVSPVLHFHLAFALFHADNHSDARTALRKANDAGLTPAKLHPLERSFLQQLNQGIKTARP